MARKMWAGGRVINLVDVPYDCARRLEGKNCICEIESRDCMCARIRWARIRRTCGIRAGARAAAGMLADGGTHALRTHARLARGRVIGAAPRRESASAVLPAPGAALSSLTHHTRLTRRDTRQTHSRRLWSVSVVSS